MKRETIEWIVRRALFLNRGREYDDLRPVEVDKIVELIADAIKKQEERDKATEAAAQAGMI